MMPERQRNRVDRSGFHEFVKGRRSVDKGKLIGRQEYLGVLLPRPQRLRGFLGCFLVGRFGLVGDRFDALAACVAVLATVRSHPARPAEGDLLDHTLEVFDRVHRERPFDEELLTAALVHDVGMAIDRRAAVAATLEAIGDLVTPRTRWLVESLPAARAYADQTLGHRARKRLEAHPDFLDALLLAEADRGGGSSGDPPPSLEQAVAVLRALDRAAAEDGDGRHPPDPRDSP